MNLPTFSSRSRRDAVNQYTLGPDPGRNSTWYVEGPDFQILKYKRLQEMGFVLIVIFSSSGLDSYSIEMQEFDDKPACVEAAKVVRDEILNKHGAVQMTLRCVAKGTKPEIRIDPQ